MPDAREIVNRPLRGRRVDLRPILPRDHQYLYELTADPQIAFRWRSRGFVVPFEQFVQTFQLGNLCQFLVVRHSDQSPIGYVFAYRADFRHSHCYMASILDGRAVRSGKGIEASVLFINYLFGTWPFRRVYAVAPTFNLDNIGQSRLLPDRCELVLKRQRYLGGQSHDVAIFSVRREDVTADPAIAWIRRGNSPALEPTNSSA